MAAQTTIVFLFAKRTTLLLFVIYRAAGRFAFADILRYFYMLRMGGIGVQILPCIEGTSQTNIVVRVLGIRNVDANGLINQYINLIL